jgi:prefoldin alpha subunit
MPIDDELAKLAYEARLCQSQLQELQRQANSAQSAIAEVSAAAAGIKSLPQVGKEGTLMGLGAGTFTAVSLRESDKILVEVGAGVFVEKSAGEAAETMEDRRKKLEGILLKLGSSMESVSRRLEAIEEKAESLGQ